MARNTQRVMLVVHYRKAKKTFRFQLRGHDMESNPIRSKDQLKIKGIGTLNVKQVKKFYFGALVEIECSIKYVSESFKKKVFS